MVKEERSGAVGELLRFAADDLDVAFVEREGDGAGQIPFAWVLTKASSDSRSGVTRAEA